MQIGTIIQDMGEDVQDIGVIIEIGECMFGAPLYHIFWVCPRPEGKDYTTTLPYSDDEIRYAFECGGFEVVA